MNYSDIFAQSNAIKQRIVSHRRKIHSFAETGFETAKTSLYIKSVLEELGVETKDVCKNGVCAFVHGKKGGKAFLVRCDIDALPVREATGLDFASDNGCMHACGHDMHAAMLLGCAELLCKMKDEFSGTVALLFQPAEELLAGAKSIIDNGLCDYVAMDIKNSKERYNETIGIDKFDISKVEKSVEILMSSGVDFEFRTTVTKNFHTVEDIQKIGEWIKGTKKY